MGDVISLLHAPRLPKSGGSALNRTTSQGFTDTVISALVDNAPSLAVARRT